MENTKSSSSLIKHNETVCSIFIRKTFNRYLRSGHDSFRKPQPKKFENSPKSFGNQFLYALRLLQIGINFLQVFMTQIYSFIWF